MAPTEASDGGASHRTGSCEVEAAEGARGHAEEVARTPRDGLRNVGRVVLWGFVLRVFVRRPGSTEKSRTVREIVNPVEAGIVVLGTATALGALFTRQRHDELFIALVGVDSAFVIAFVLAAQQSRSALGKAWHALLAGAIGISMFAALGPLTLDLASNWRRLAAGISLFCTALALVALVHAAWTVGEPSDDAPPQWL